MGNKIIAAILVLIMLGLIMRRGDNQRRDLYEKAVIDLIADQATILRETSERFDRLNDRIKALERSK